jgi:EAL domain-containing protein (putative c-di-GMP-specific phosphodiesterase class I)
MIFREGEPGDSAFIVERGLVEISALKGGKRIVLASLGGRHVFGEMALIDDEVRSATATALEDTEAVIVTRDYFQERFASADPIIHLFLRVVLERFRDTHFARIRGEKAASLRPPSQSYLGEQERALLALRFQHELEEALLHKQLYLHYQPIVRIADRHIVGFEALMRWNHPDKGRIPPGRFIGFAEQCGLIVPMGLWAMREANRGLTVLQNSTRSDEPLFMSVNVSGRQLTDESQREELIVVLTSSALDVRRIKLEITESLLMDDPNMAAATLSELKGMGVSLAIDDFGTGYSSLSYLHRFPLDTLKIDGSFVQAMHGDAGSMKIVRAIASLAHDLEMDIVAEGVETAEQLQTLTELGCQYAQGYHFSRPVELDEAEKLLGQPL